MVRSGLIERLESQLIGEHHPQHLPSSPSAGRPAGRQVCTELEYSLYSRFVGFVSGTSRTAVNRLAYRDDVNQRQRTRSGPAAHSGYYHQGHRAVDGTLDPAQHRREPAASPAHNPRG